MSASPPPPPPRGEEEETETESRPVAPLPVPAPAALQDAADIEDASVTSADSDAPSPLTTSPSQRPALTYEEFRRLYVASHQANYASSHGRAAGAPVPAASPATAAPPPAARDGVGTLRQRLFAAANDAAGRPAPPTAPVQPGRLARGVRTLGAWLSALAEHAMHNRAFVLQMALVFSILYYQTNLGGLFLLGLLALYAVVMAMQMLIRNFEVGHEAGATAAPSFLGRLFKPEGHTGPVSIPRKFGYIVTKCAEALLLSIFPTYSLEHLERELNADGIVR
ncbi:hypothetical protein NESM_000594400 [Novymonas esmeraldas]|uniref:Uncharacterized protein n=1 Tax=Novymonas esmeraldas TaxID=1808958 RepID=A0AAW0EQZ8_9TRYP